MNQIRSTHWPCSYLFKFDYNIHFKYLSFYNWNSSRPRTSTVWNEKSYLSSSLGNLMRYPSEWGWGRYEQSFCPLILVRSRLSIQINGGEKPIYCGTPIYCARARRSDIICYAAATALPSECKERLGKGREQLLFLVRKKARNLYPQHHPQEQDHGLANKRG